MHTAQIFGSSIVIVGAFNPAIFTPEWLERNNLIGAQDAEAARNHEASVVSREVTICQTDSFQIEVTLERIAISSVGALTPALGDLAEGILMLLPQTPITALGLNYMGHYQLDNFADYHKVGDVLAPKQIWSDIFPETIVGLFDLSLQIQTGSRDNASTDDEIRISVQPSKQVKHGIFFAYNHHIEKITSTKLETAADKARELIKNNWEKDWGRSTNSFIQILEKSIGSDK